MRVSRTNIELPEGLHPNLVLFQWIAHCFISEMQQLFDEVGISPVAHQHQAIWEDPDLFTKMWLELTESAVEAGAGKV